MATSADADSALYCFWVLYMVSVMRCALAAFAAVAEYEEAGFDVARDANIVWLFDCFGDSLGSVKLAFAVHSLPSASLLHGLSAELENVFAVIGAKLYWNEDCLLIVYLASWADVRDTVRCVVVRHWCLNALSRVVV